MSFLWHNAAGRPTDARPCVHRHRGSIPNLAKLGKEARAGSHKSGGSDRRDFKVKRSGKDRKLKLDCTHLRYSPFLYEPVWWALKHLAVL